MLEGVKGPPTVPVALKPVAGLTVRDPGRAVKFAVTDVLLLMVSVSGLLVPVASPLQLLKIYPALGVAVSVT